MNNIPYGKGYIYIMVAKSRIAQIPENTYYKIGLSVDPTRRKEEIERGVSPFLSIDLVETYPVEEMRTAEKKLHDLFDEERIAQDAEWFHFQPQHFEAVKNLSTMMTTLAAPTRVRRSQRGILFTPIDIEIGEAAPTTKLNTELESLILSYIVTRSRHPKCFEDLKLPVIARGQTYMSPEEMWSTHTGFRQWVAERLSWLSKQPNANAQRAVNLIRAYGTEKFGWLDYIPETPYYPERKKVAYGDD